MKPIFALCLLLTGMLLLAGCAQQTNSTTSIQNQVRNIDNGQVGQSYDVNSSSAIYQVTLSKTAFETTTYEGTQYLMANFEIKNIGDTSAYFSPNIYALDTSSEKYDKTFGSGLPSEYSNLLTSLTTLGPGQKTSGWVAIKVPVNQSSFDVYFEYTNPAVSRTPRYIKYPSVNASANLTNTNTAVNPMNSKNPVVNFETTKGNFSAEIFVNEAPITGNNFMKLVRSGFYNNLTFHRVITGFMAQGGDPKGDGSGGSNETIALEIKPNLKHKLGTLAMARSQNPNSASSQFYIVNGEASFLDGQYAVFGQVLGSGMSVVNQFATGEPPRNPDRMLKVYEKQ